MSGRMEKNILSQYKPPEGSNEQNSSRHEAHRKRKQKEEEITPVRLNRKRKETEVTSSVDRKKNRKGDMATSGEWKVTSVDRKINLRKWKEEKDKEKRKHPGGESDVEDESSSAQGNGCQMIETYGNLFKAPMNHSLAHCVAADMRMGSGIAVNFRQKLGHVGELLDQLAGVGDVAILKIDERFIYYLVTKEFSNGKPKMADLISSLKKMREHCERKRIKYVSIPKLGCGLDRLYWNEVKTAIYKVFTDLDIKIIVHDFNPPKSYYFKQNAVYIERDNDVLLTTIASKEVVLLLGTKDNCFISSSSVNLLKQLDKYRYYMQANKKMGQIVQITGVRPMFGLIVKETYRDMFSYKNFENCLLELRTEVEEGHIKRIALEEFGNRMTMEKVITVIKHVFEFTGIKVIICKNWQRKQYYRYSNQMSWQHPQVHQYRYQSTK